jgi:penicillin-binding protein-related factor A (putative recombinase)
MVLIYEKESPADEKSVKHGYSFESEIRNSLSLLTNCWFGKWSDTHMYQNFHSKIKLPKSPADYIAMLLGDDFNPRPVFLECKSTHNSSSFDFFNIPDHQLETGLKVGNLNVPYYFLINRRVSRKQRVFVLDPYTVKHIRDTLLKKGKRSLKWENISMYAIKSITPIDITNRTYDLSWIRSPIGCYYDKEDIHVDYTEELSDEMLNTVVYKEYPDLLGTRRTRSKHVPKRVTNVVAPTEGTPSP